MNTIDRRGGFTLTEVLVAMVILSILAAVAYPSYMEHVRKSRRAEATIALETLSQAQERFFAQHRTYTPVIVGPPGCSGLACGLNFVSNETADGHYVLTAAGDTTSYRVTASAVGNQMGDTKCTAFSLNNLGARNSIDISGADTTRNCW